MFPNRMELRRNGKRYTYWALPRGAERREAATVPRASRMPVSAAERHDPDAVRMPGCSPPIWPEPHTQKTHEQGRVLAARRNTKAH